LKGNFRLVFSSVDRLAPDFGRSRIMPLPLAAVIHQL
jgi:hypothetical protein